MSGGEALDKRADGIAEGAWLSRVEQRVVVVEGGGAGVEVCGGRGSGGGAGGR